MSTTDQVGSGSGIDAETWAAAQRSPEFTALRRRLRNFVFPVSALFLAWYLVYVLLADYAHGFMSIKVVGNINIGLVLGLLQFVSTFAITTWYVRYANRHLDPVAEGIRESLESGAGVTVSEEDAQESGKGDAEKAETPADDAEKGSSAADDAPADSTEDASSAEKNEPTEDSSSAEKAEPTEDSSSAEKAEPTADAEGGQQK